VVTNSVQSVPRRRLVRVALTLSLVTVLLGGWLAARHFVILALIDDGPLTDVLSLVYPMILTALLTPLVSYRCRDAAAWLIPPLALVLVFRVAWRLSLLPLRDWPPRPGEIDRVIPIAGSDGHWRQLYMLKRRSGEA
jgi:hypothetical protein